MDADATRDANALKDRLDTELADATPGAPQDGEGALKEPRSIRAKRTERTSANEATAAEGSRPQAELRRQSARKVAQVALATAREGLDGGEQLLATGEATLKDFDSGLPRSKRSEGRELRPGRAPQPHRCLTTPPTRSTRWPPREKRLVDDIACVREGARQTPGRRSGCSRETRTPRSSTLRPSAKHLPRPSATTPRHISYKTSRSATPAPSAARLSARSCTRDVATWTAPQDRLRSRPGSRGTRTDRSQQRSKQQLALKQQASTDAETQLTTLRADDHNPAGRGGEATP